ILLENDYLFVYADGLNRYYLCKERPDLLDRFRYPPNVFDNFISAELMRERRRAEEAGSQLSHAFEELALLRARVERVEGSLTWRLSSRLRRVLCSLRRLIN